MILLRVFSYLNLKYCRYINKTTIQLVEFINKKGDHIMWTTPVATEMRFGFEVTMYVMNK